MNILVFIGSLATFLAVAAFTFLMLNIKDMHNRIMQLYALVDILSESSTLPIRTLYSYIKECKPDEIPKTRKELLFIMRNLTIKQFEQDRKTLYEEFSDENDSLNKKRLQMSLEEIDNNLTLLSTIDRDTSEEYSEDIFNNVFMSLIKMKILRLDL